jgi:hypothetical protein
MAKPSAYPVAAQVIVPRPTQPHPYGRPIDGHTPVVVPETGPLVAPLPVAELAPPSSGGGSAEVKVDPISTEIVIKEWKEVNMAELFETNGLSAVLRTFAEKECNPLMTLGKDCPTGTCALRTLAY